MVEQLEHKRATKALLRSESRDPIDQANHVLHQRTGSVKPYGFSSPDVHGHDASRDGCGGRSWADDEGRIIGSSVCFKRRSIALSSTYSGQVTFFHRGRPLHGFR